VVGAIHVAVGVGRNQATCNETTLIDGPLSDVCFKSQVFVSELIFEPGGKVHLMFYRDKSAGYARPACCAPRVGTACVVPLVLAASLFGALLWGIKSFSLVSALLSLIISQYC